MTTTSRLDPHRNIRISLAGEPLPTARGVLIMLHGRGATAQSAIDLASALSPVGLAILAPQAAEASWYPNRFTRPSIENEPHLTSALNAIARLVAQATSLELPTQKIVIGGFSQGACLALEFAARFPARYGGVIGFSGGLIGDENAPLVPPRSGTPLNGTPVFIGTTDHDSHIPLKRVHDTAEILQVMGASVTLKIYPGFDHTVNEDEITHASRIVARVSEPV